MRLGASSACVFFRMEKSSFTNMDLTDDFFHIYDPDTSYGWFRIALLLKLRDGESDSDMTPKTPDAPSMRRNIASFGSSCSYGSDTV